MSFKPSKPIKEVAPEDNWNLVANPDKYIDQLPQPYRFIEKCLDNLIMKPVFNTITEIEKKKKTPEYEGNLKEVTATGFMDINGVTAIAKMNQVCLAGGNVEKFDSNNFGSEGIFNKVILGDKFG
jgi:hypothetical protein